MEPKFRGYDFYGVSTWKRNCGLSKFMENLADEITPQNFPKYVASPVAIATIDGDALDTYHTPAVNDFVIKQKDPKSWIEVGKKMARKIARRYKSGYASVVVLQHDFGLDSDWENGSHSYADLANAVREEAENLGVPDDYLFIVSYLHTVKEKIK